MILENDNNYKPDQINGRTRHVTTPYTGLGKLPPQAVDLEESLLGSCMSYQNMIMKVIDILKPEMFYKDNHQKIYNACLALVRNNDPVDELTVTAQLRKLGELEMVGGAYYLVELTKSSSTTNIEFNARIIQQKFIARELIRLGTECINSAYEDTTDILELSERMQMDVYKITDHKKGKKIHAVKDKIAERIEYYKMTPKGTVTGVKSGISNLDNMTNGWKKGSLVIIAARPAMGKTAFALTCTKEPAKEGLPVMVEELEMTADELTDRLISSESGVNLDDIIKHNLDSDDFLTFEIKLKKIIESKIFIDDTPGQTLMGLRSKAILYKQLYDIKLLVVDYIQLMKGSQTRGQSREQEISEITRGLKEIAKELDIPVIALSQLSRAVEDRPGGDKTPRLSDLRESGSIEQDADVVIFLLRPEYYGIKEYDGESTHKLCLAIIAKNRQGVTGVAKMQFNGAQMTFSDWAVQQFTPVQRDINF